MFSENTLKHEFLSEISKPILNYKISNLQANYLERTLCYSYLSYFGIPSNKKKAIDSTYCDIWQFINKIGMYKQ